MVGGLVSTRFTFGWGPSRLEAEAMPIGERPFVRFTCLWQGRDGGAFECLASDLRSLLEEGAPFRSEHHRLELKDGSFYYRCITPLAKGKEKTVSIELERLGLMRLLATLG